MQEAGRRPPVLYAVGQATWIALSVLVIGIVMCLVSPAFRTYDNIFTMPVCTPEAVATCKKQ